MCVIVIKKRGISLPENFKDILKACWYSNRDGAGFAVHRYGEKAIYFEKGFMTLGALYEAIEKVPINNLDEFMVHFRIGTQGPKNAQMTHPFVVSKDTNIILNTLKGIVKRPIVAHNGCFRGNELDSRDYSDTFLFARDILGTYEEKMGRRAKKKWRERFSRHISGQRLCIMFPDRELELLGSFYYYNKLFFSNSSFKTYLTSSLNDYSKKNFETDDEDSLSRMYGDYCSV